MSVLSRRALIAPSLITRGLNSGEQLDLSRDFIQWRVFRKFAHQIHYHFAVTHIEIIDVDGAHGNWGIGES